MKKNNKSKAFEAIFVFEDEAFARDFLAYMSDGGGEQGFVDPDTMDMAADWDYHSLNRGKFGPKVKVTRAKR